MKKRIYTAGHDREWDEILALGERRWGVGEEEMVDFFAEVWNGGIEQWVVNGRLRDMRLVQAVAKKMGAMGNKLASKLSRLSPVLRKLDSITDDEGAYEEAAEVADSFDDWFYAVDDKLVKELLELMQSSRTASRRATDKKTYGPRKAVQTVSENKMNRESRIIAAKKCLALASAIMAEEEGGDEQDEQFASRVRALKTKLNKLGQKKRRKLNQYGIDRMKPSATVEDLVGALEKVLAEA